MDQLVEAFALPDRPPASWLEVSPQAALQAIVLSLMDPHLPSSAASRLAFEVADALMESSWKAQDLMERHDFKTGVKLDTGTQRTCPTSQHNMHYCNSNPNPNVVIVY